MNNIVTYNSDFQCYREHYDSLKEIKTLINSQVKALTDDDTDSFRIRELLRLRDFINSAMQFCGERMYANVQGIGHELIHMEGDTERYER
ncbi:MAG: hypothetical protein IJP85_05730 [Synergistaceae bacterium]|nr:hypothetical protein [Synergistaceae bacterium]